MVSLTDNKPRIGVSIALQHAVDGRFLLVKRSKAPAKGMWAFPGGSLDFGECLIDGAKRELMEETGLTACNVAFFDHVEIVDREADIHFLLCVHTGIGEDEPVAADDAEDARWVAVSDIESLPATASTLAFAKRIANGAFKQK